jgi:hypothetical protein
MAGSARDKPVPDVLGFGSGERVLDAPDCERRAPGRGLPEHESTR